MEYKPAGITQQLTEYILKNLKKGYTLDSLKYSLLNQGYSKISIEKAVDYANKQLAEKIPPIKEKPEITYKVIDDSEVLTNNYSEVHEEEPITIKTEKKGFWQKIFR